MKTNRCPVKDALRCIMILSGMACAVALPLFGCTIDPTIVPVNPTSPLPPLEDLSA